MKYDTLSFQTNFPLNCPRRESLVNLLKKGEVVRLAGETGRGTAGKGVQFWEFQRGCRFLSVGLRAQTRVSRLPQS